MLQIDIESTEIIERQKRDRSGSYFQQQAYVHTCDRDGRPMRHPELIFIFVPKDERGQPQPYKQGKYTLAPQSLVVRNRQLDLGFLNLVPMKPSQAA